MKPPLSYINNRIHPRPTADGYLADAIGDVLDNGHEAIALGSKKSVICIDDAPDRVGLCFGVNATLTDYRLRVVYLWPATSTVQHKHRVKCIWGYQP